MLGLVSIKGNNIFFFLSPVSTPDPHAQELRNIPFGNIYREKQLVNICQRLACCQDLSFDSAPPPSQFSSSISCCDVSSSFGHDLPHFLSQRDGIYVLLLLQSVINPWGFLTSSCLSLFYEHRPSLHSFLLSPIHSGEWGKIANL